MHITEMGDVLLPSGQEIANFHVGPSTLAIAWLCIVPRSSILQPALIHGGVGCCKWGIFIKNPFWLKFSSCNKYWPGMQVNISYCTISSVLAAILTGKHSWLLVIPIPKYTFVMGLVRATLIWIQNLRPPPCDLHSPIRAYADVLNQQLNINQGLDKQVTNQTMLETSPLSWMMI